MQLELENGADLAYVKSIQPKIKFMLGRGWISKQIRTAATHLLSPLQPTPVIPNLETWAVKNTALAAHQLILAATSLGLATAPMEGFDERRLCYQLNIPIEDYSIPLVVSIGYSLKAGEDNINTNEFDNTDNTDLSNIVFPKKARFKIEDVCYSNTFGKKLSFD
jgi:nitroreductase